MKSQVKNNILTKDLLIHSPFDLDQEIEKLDILVILPFFIKMI